MPSRALAEWRGRRSDELDELLAAHAAVGGTGRGRRYATEQVNRAYALAVAAQFQGFCRDLHSEAVRSSWPSPSHRRWPCNCASS